MLHDDQEGWDGQGGGREERSGGGRDGIREGSGRGEGRRTKEEGRCARDAGGKVQDGRGWKPHPRKIRDGFEGAASCWAIHSGELRKTNGGVRPPSARWARIEKGKAGEPPALRQRDRGRKCRGQDARARSG